MTLGEDKFFFCRDVTLGRWEIYTALRGVQEQDYIIYTDWAPHQEDVGGNENQPEIYGPRNCMPLKVSGAFIVCWLMLSEHLLTVLLN